jgi:hypothetical protein
MVFQGRKHGLSLFAGRISNLEKMGYEEQNTLGTRRARFTMGKVLG